MPSKSSIEKIKNYIEIISNSGCKLISKDYINRTDKLEIKCACGNIFFISYSNFKNKNYKKCRSCVGEITGEKLRKSNDEIREYIEGLGYFLKGNDYKNNVENISFYDNDGYFYTSSITNLKANKLPSKFYKTNPYTIDNIKLWCKSNNPYVELLSNIYKGNDKKLKWKCLKNGCGEIFEMNWNNMLQGQNCSYCCSPAKKVGLSNCIATKNPELAAEWHPTKNGDLTPFDVTIGSGKEIWWQCTKNKDHVWKAAILDRKHNGCAFCSGRRASNEYNLLITNPELCEEWDYKKNDKKPEEYTRGSEKIIWWRCNECSYEWKASICNRSRGYTGCPLCSQSKGEKRIKDFIVNYNIKYIYEKKFNNLFGTGGGKLSYDFYLPSYNLLIEYQGEFHDGNGNYYMKQNLQKQQEHDRRKREYAKNNNINLLEIWYHDIEKIEDILNNELKIDEDLHILI